MNPIQVSNNNEEDHQVDGWSFIFSIWSVGVLIILAFAVVLYGPTYMRTRQPLNIGPIMAFYNIFIVVFNIYIACQLWIGGSRKQYSWICQPNDSPATDIEEIRIVEALHLAFICKLVELFDSFFLIALKKSTGKHMLMLFHHVFMVCLGWIGLHWVPSVARVSAFAATFINAVVHAVIYAYFFLLIFLPRALKPFIKTAFFCFMVIQYVGCIVYGLIIIWVECPLASLFAYPLLILLLGMLIYNIKQFFFDYPRYGDKREGFVSYCMKTAIDYAD